MEIEKVIRILAVFVAAAALAIHFATPLIFPEASWGFDLPLVVVLILCVGSSWSSTACRKENRKK